jgi:hypothetical protein
LPFAGRFIFSGGLPGEDWMFRELGKSNAALTVGGNVASVCYSLAVAAGCDPIVLVGQDLALGEDARVHAAGIADNWQEFLDRAAVVAEERGEAERPHRVRAPGYFGGEVITLTNMLSYIQWYEHNIPRVRAMFGQRTINATEGGARIGGAEQAPLAQVITKHMKQRQDVAARLAAAGASMPCDRARLRESFGGHRQTAIELTAACARGSQPEIEALLKPIAPLVDPLYRRKAWRATAQWRDQEAERRAAIRRAQEQAATTVAEALERIVRFLSEPPPAST